MGSIMRDSALEQLKSAEQSELMDAIDRLRGQGFEKELDLPQLIVCGDQSSGKSSVMEAISQISFPAGTSTTTRFASELVLRNSPKTTMKATLQASQSSDVPLEDRELLGQFSPEFHGPADFPSIHEDAVRHLQRLRRQSDFYPHRLRVELSGPKQPHLTLVDLPGLIAVAPEGKEQNISTVRKIMESYMQQPRSIILAVIPATEDPDIKQVLGCAKAFDRHGSRTMGILTKPDLIQKGTTKMFIDLVQNQYPNCRLDLGWHVLRNQNSAETPALHRDEVERKFFNDPQGEWCKVPEDLKGVDSLRPRLRDILFQRITGSIPHLIKDMDDRIITWERRQQRLGPPRAERKDQLIFLGKICDDLKSLVQQAARGTYAGDFFTSDVGHTRETRRLRNALRKRFDDFKGTMEDTGARYSIVQADQDSVSSWYDQPKLEGRLSILAGSESKKVSRHELIIAIKDFIESHRGLELEGEYSDGMVEQVFKVQCTPWEKIAREAIHGCLATAQHFFRLALDHVAPRHTANTIYNEIAAKKFENMRRDLDSKLEELLSPFQKLHPYTVDPAYIAERDARDKDDDQSKTELYTATKVLNRVEAYYKISMRKFIDNIVALAVENCIVGRLDGIFTIATVLDLEQHDPAKYQRFANEPREVVLDREDTLRNLITLREVREMCSRHAHYEAQSHSVLEQDRDQDQNSQLTGNGFLGSGLNFAISSKSGQIIPVFPDSTNAMPRKDNLFSFTTPSNASSKSMPRQRDHSNRRHASPSGLFASVADGTKRRSVTPTNAPDFSKTWSSPTVTKEGPAASGPSPSGSSTGNERSNTTTLPNGTSLFGSTVLGPSNSTPSSSTPGTPGVFGSKSG